MGPRLVEAREPYEIGNVAAIACLAWPAAWAHLTDADLVASQ